VALGFRCISANWRERGIVYTNDDPPQALPILLGQPSTFFYGEFPNGNGRVNHTDLHLSCVVGTFKRYAKHLLKEMLFPARIRRSKGYAEVRAEVECLLLAENMAINKQDHPLFDIVLWERQVEDQGDIISASGNRKITEGEWRGSVAGAKSALNAFEGAQEQQRQLRIVRLGDNNDLCRGEFAQIFDLHRKNAEGGRRTLLQQLQFLSAVMEVSGARLIVGQRSGLTDLLCKASGVPMCQFNIKEGHDSGDQLQRLRSVWASGAGMGYVVSPWSSNLERGSGKDEDIVQECVAGGCIESMLVRRQLELECEGIVVPLFLEGGPKIQPGLGFVKSFRKIY